MYPFDYLTKPYTKERFLEALDRVAEKGGSASISLFHAGMTLELRPMTTEGYGLFHGAFFVENDKFVLLMA